MAIITFGKHRGQDISEVPLDYVKWMTSVSGTSVVADFAKRHHVAIAALLNAEVTKMVAAAPPVTVTPHQQSAVDHLYSAILNGQHVVRLDGGAGYGKSYAVKKLALQLREAGYQFRACATSYVATQVLARDLEPYGFEAATVARTLKQAKVQDADTGKEDYVLTPDSYDQMASLLAPLHALCLDEASMVKDEIASALIAAAERNGGALILVGDRYQLPPVGQETYALACDTPDPATLTEPMRYTRDSELFALEQMARFHPRNVLDYVDALSPYATPEVRRVHNASDLIDAYVRNYQEHPEASHRMLLFRRADVVGANNRIRAALHGPEAAVIEDSERVMVLRTTDTPYVPNAGYGDTVRYYSGESFTVTDAHQDELEILGVTIPHWVVRLQGRERLIRIIFAISETQTEDSKLGGPEYAEAIALAGQIGRDTKNWEPWKELTNSFVSVAYQYATSVHRAQGQTTDFAYVVPAPLLAVRGIIGPALAYVALTRARKQCVVQV
jgi:exodeoxyribonuclease-5